MSLSFWVSLKCLVIGHMKADQTRALSLSGHTTTICPTSVCSWTQITLWSLCDLSVVQSQRWIIEEGGWNSIHTFSGLNWSVFQVESRRRFDAADSAPLHFRSTQQAALVVVFGKVPTVVFLRKTFVIIIVILWRYCHTYNSIACSRDYILKEWNHIVPYSYISIKKVWVPLNINIKI